MPVDWALWNSKPPAFSFLPSRFWSKSTSFSLVKAGNKRMKTSWRISRNTGTKVRFGKIKTSDRMSLRFLLSSSNLARFVAEKRFGIQTVKRVVTWLSSNENISKTDTKIVDIGCGNGYTCCKLVRSLDAPQGQTFARFNAVLIVVVRLMKATLSSPALTTPKRPSSSPSRSVAKRISR